MSSKGNDVLFNRSKQITFGPSDYSNDEGSKLHSREIYNISKFNDFDEEEIEMSIPDELSNGKY